MLDAPRMKICGVTDLGDAQLAVDAGAWAIGLVLYEASPRCCDPAHAELIARTLRRRAQIVGVFVNETLDTVAADVDALGLTMVQLHGDEGPAYCEEIRRRTGARVIKAGRVQTAADLRALDAFRTDFHLLDAYDPAVRGGTGETWDWALLAHRRSRVPLILSGGLHAGNVEAAIATVQPYAVDSASGTEASPGHKDPERLSAFAAAVDRAGAPLAGPAEVTS